MFLDKIKGKLGFGCMRLPMVDNEVDKEKFCEMVFLISLVSMQL